jgi:hypothetical protein
VCEADSREWLREVAELVGAPGGWALLDDPLRWLADYLESQARTDREPDQLPSLASIHGRASRLLTVPEAIDWLKDERGLTEDTIRRAGLGWESEPPAFTFPILNAAGELVNVVRRPWPTEDPKYRGCTGRNQHNGGVQLYPHPLPEGSWLLVEGLLDALLGRQEGLPQTVTGTAGVNTFLEEWLPLVRGRRVAVMYDVGAEKVMRRRVDALRAAGAEAWAVRLSELDLPPKGDLSDALTGGYDAADIINLIKDSDV